MENSEKEFNKRQRQRLVVYMSLKTMFPDPQVRALAKAAGKGKISKIDKLVKEGVDVNSRGTSNATPLFWPMRKNNIKGFTRLLEHGADPNVIYDDGGTVIHWAVIHKDERFLIAALKHGGNPNLPAGQEKEPPIFDAAVHAGKDKAGILLDAGADINARDEMGNTPVMVAAGMGQFDLVYYLLERGADYTITDNFGNNLVDAIQFIRSKIICRRY